MKWPLLATLLLAGCGGSATSPARSQAEIVIPTQSGRDTRDDAPPPRAEPIEAVDRTEFWQVVLGSGVNVAWPVQRFINLWLDAVGAGADVVNSDELRTAIRDRERQLKKSLARLANPHALEMWRGDAGVARFDFRWRVGRSAVNDIATGLQAA